MNRRAITEHAKQWNLTPARVLLEAQACGIRVGRTADLLTDSQMLYIMQQLGREQVRRARATACPNGAQAVLKPDAIPVPWQRDHLSAEEQRAYDAILNGINRMEAETELAEYLVTTDRIDPLLKKVLADHPEIFWVDEGKGCSYRYLDRRVTTLVNCYRMSADEKTRREKELQQSLTAYLWGLSDTLSDYQLAVRLYERLADMLDYDSAGLDEEEAAGKSGPRPKHLRTVYGALVLRKVVCAGFAKAYQYLLNRLGVPCLYMSGPSGDGRHAWNLVQLEGNWYHVDVTWGCRGNTKAEQDREGISYAWFGLTDEEILHSRTFDPWLEHAACTATGCCYLRRNGLYLDRWQPEWAVGAASDFMNRMNSGRAELKFGSEEVLRTAREFMVNGDGFRQALSRAGRANDGTIWSSVDEGLKVLSLSDRK